MNRILPTVLLATFLIVPSFGQDTLTFDESGDSVMLSRHRTMIEVDTLVVAQPDFSHSPSKAIMFALVLPGLGQAYNKKYYKIPIVWAAMGVAGYAINYNTKKYRESSREYAQVPDDTNERYLRFWRRNMELSYIGMLLAYALQVVDSYVDAELYSWDVSEDLSLRVAPSMQPLMAPASITGHAYGITCSIDLKRR